MIVGWVARAWADATPLVERVGPAAEEPSTPWPLAAASVGALVLLIVAIVGRWRAR